VALLLLLLLLAAAAVVVVVWWCGGVVWWCGVVVKHCEDGSQKREGSCWRFCQLVLRLRLAR
jgi:hypothetical protein